MFDGIGLMELLLVGIIGLIVLGPERLPVAVRSVAGWIRTIKRMANSVKDELEQELKIEQLHADLKKAESKGLANLSPDLQESIDKLKEAAQSVNRPYQVEDIVGSDKETVVDTTAASALTDKMDASHAKAETTNQSTPSTHSNSQSNG